MWLIITNTVTKIQRATELETAWLDAYLAFPDEKARFRRRDPNDDGRRPMLDVFNMTFPTGLLPLVRDGAAKAGHKVEVLRDERRVPCGPDPKADISWLADYQDEAVEQAVAKGRGVFWCPTGSGKTEVVVALGLVFPCRWGVLVHSKSLVKEIADRFEQRTGEQAGVVGDGTFAPRRFTVATFQTVQRGLDREDARVQQWLESLQAIDVDECHVVPSDTFYRVVMAAENAYYRFGNSATPFARGDRKGVLVVAALGPKIYRIEQKVLVEAGAIARGKIHLAKHVADAAAAQFALEERATYGEAYEQMIVENDDRNAFVVRLARAAPKPAFLFVRLLEHGKRLTAMLNAAGVSSEFVWGAKHVKQREAAVRRLEHGDTDVVVCNVVFQAGVNVPTLASVINAAGGKSRIAALQQTGRGSRRRDRDGVAVKDEFSVYDVHDVSCGCKGKTLAGKVKWKHAACRWLETHARARRRSYLSEGYEVIEVGNV